MWARICGGKLLSYKIRRFNSLTKSMIMAIATPPSSLVPIYKNIYSTIFLIDIKRINVHEHKHNHELLILCSNFHSLIDMFNACNSNETDYCRVTAAEQCTISRLVLLIGELCDWTNTIKRLQMQCNWQSMICLFISLCVCISIFFYYLLLINYLDWFDDDDDVDTIFMVFPSIECCCFFNAMNLLLADRKWSNDVLYHF